MFLWNKSEAYKIVISDIYIYSAILVLKVVADCKPRLMPREMFQHSAPQLTLLEYMIWAKKSGNGSVGSEIVAFHYISIQASMESCGETLLKYVLLTHWGRDKMAPFSRRCF